MDWIPSELMSTVKAFELAGIGTSDLRTSFELCYQVHRRTDPATCLALELLPFQKRPYLHAVYAFGKTSDDIADETEGDIRDQVFSEWSAATLKDLNVGRSDHPIRKALVHTVGMWGLQIDLIEEFLSATAKDGERAADFATFEQLREHLRGVFGSLAELTLPIFEPTGPAAYNKRLMSLLGEVAQMVDIFRDFPTDLPRGRYYLPLNELERFGLLKDDLRGKAPSPQLDAFVRYQLDRARRMLDESAEVVESVHPSSRPFFETAVTGLHAYLDLFSRQESAVLWRSTDLLLPSTLLDSGTPLTGRPIVRNDPDLGRAELPDRAPISRRGPVNPSSAPQSPVPRHVAVIMDGNRRWAAARGRPLNAGYSAGWLAEQRLMDSALKLGIGNLSLFAFSTENWSRPSIEIAAVFDIAIQAIRRDQEELNEKGVRLRWSGRRDRVPNDLRARLESAEQLTVDNTRLTVNLCLDYGGRTEIVDAARKMAIDASAGIIDPNTASEDNFASYLYQPDLPDVDLLIRTSSEKRISNFVLWHVAYAEMDFIDVMWPDFRHEHLLKAIEEFARRDRPLGGDRKLISSHVDESLFSEKDRRSVSGLG